MRSKPATQYIAWRNRMRTQHPNLWHPIRFAIMLIVPCMDHIRRLLRASYRHIWRDMGCDAGYGARTVSAVSEKYIGGDSRDCLHRRSVYSLRAFGKFSSRAALRLWHARIQH